MTKNETFQHLTQVVFENLPEILTYFDKYQLEFFPKRSPEFFCLELNGEAGELANSEKKIWKGKKIANEELAEEAADVFIALINYVNTRKIDLTDSLLKKLNRIEEKRLELQSKGESY
jgi:NTP pyrophosphatase (non-canonical NTP hydrolase)